MFNKGIQEKLNYYFRVNLNLKDSTNDFIRGDCPFCGGRFTFGVNLSSNRTNCFKCEYDKRPTYAIMELENLNNYSELTKLLSKADSWEFIPKLEKHRTKAVVRKEVSLPDYYRPILLGESQLGKSARSYLKSRGYNLKSLALKGIGYCYDGPYYGFIVIPYYLRGELIYWKTRSFIGAKAFNNPDEEMFGIGKNNLIYNIDALALYNTVNIVESETNTLTLGDNTIGLGGKSISDWQFSCLIKSPVEKYNILLDPDAIEDALNLSMRLTQYKRIKCVSWVGTQDVNDLGKRVAKYYIKHTPEKNYSQLLKQKLEL